MKKFMKFCAIAALVLIAAGAVTGVLAGSIQGADKMEEIVSSVMGDRMHVDLGTDGSGNWGVWIGDKVRDNLDKWDSGKRYKIEEDSDFSQEYPLVSGDTDSSFSGAEIDSLDIEAGACRMIFAASADEDFHIEVRNAGKTQYYAEKGTLKIRAVRKTAVAVQENCEITLYVPEDFAFQEVDIEMGAGVLELESLKARKADIEADAGRVSCSGMLTADELELKIGAGEILIESADVGRLEADVGMGGLRLNGAIRKSADLECAMGSIELELSGTEEDFNYNLEAAMGGVEIGGSSVAGLADHKTIDNKADREMKLECSMGSIKIRFTE